MKEKRYLGQHDNEPIFLSKPTWDCGWYWSFGYLGNAKCHYHLSNLNKETNLFDGMRKHFGDSLIIKKDQDLWTFCELAKTVYTLKETAEVLSRGGSYYTTNPVCDLIKNPLEAERINKIVLPAIFAEIEKIFTKYREI